MKTTKERALGILGLVQVTFDVVVLLAILLLWIRLRKGPQEDGRLSRGLQILQSKIAILEDLSDRTDVQAKQISALLDQKGREVQEKIFLAEKHNQLIKKSIDESLEVAKIFQDKIPHKEIIERQKTLKYIKAARMAHEGVSAEQIASELDIPSGELDFIVKVNRDGLMFSAENLPEWAKQDPTVERVDDKAALRNLGERFREAQRPAPPPRPPLTPAAAITAPSSDDRNPSVIQRLSETKVFKKAMEVLEGDIILPAEDSKTDSGSLPTIRPFEFKKINVNDNLG